jgi:hypothetical protein
MANNPLKFLFAASFALSSCGPEGQLRVNTASPNQLEFRIDSSDDEGKCIGDLSIYRLDKNLNYEEADKVFSISFMEVKCKNSAIVRLPDQEGVRGDSDSYRAISENGVYVYTVDFRYDGVSLQEF